MTFLATNFLFGLFALPIPFIIHLWHQHRLKKIWFPSISIIIQAKEGEKSLRRLKDIILLILRTLAILFLVLAFANPAVILKQKIAILDDSWDMHTKSGKQTVFEKAEKVATSLKNTKILLASGKPYPSLCKHQKFHLPTTGIDYVITKTGKLSGTVDAKLIEIDYNMDNFSIDSVASTPAAFLTFVRNHTSQEVNRLITLYTDTKKLETYLSIPSYTTSAAIFPPLPGACMGLVKIEEDDALPIDNTRYFVYSLPTALKVLIVGSPNDAFFLKNALSPTEGISTITVETSTQLINPTAYDVIAYVVHTPPTLEQIHKKTILFPVQAPEVKGKLRLTYLAEDHPIFSGLEFMDELKEIKFTHRKKLVNLTRGHKIATFSDGSPAIVEHHSGALEFMFPLSLQSKEFVLSPLFPVLMHRIAYWVAGTPIEKHNFIVGEVVRFRVPEFKPYDILIEQTSVPVKDKLTLTPKVEPTGIYVYFVPELPGIYELQGINKFAVNVSSALSYPELHIEQSHAPVSIKKWFLLIVLLLLTSELIIRRK